ncbi:MULTISPECIES: M24 family metallopeptidase [Erwiniaceae]|uniref:M24 family metallopeptidase n=1 Tax=Erwiniaceae TaxID=1903409 RepID=UPI00190BDA90|nr:MULTISPECIES: M24 family metallopeptidase [Erwiniaceae]MBK0091342.1 M24 family metallopeptidase [Erwinia sp. S59]MBK0122310.1 M24 family metallopeptidase [Pantoea sp. S61]MBK0122981.1 M24 family metallopeptidase [Pantoea sp. S61]
MMSPSIQLGPTKAPTKFTQVEPVFLSDETMLERKNKVLQGMANGGFDALVIYADKEHGGNFEYLTGFIPRFEEGLLIVDASGVCTVILGNENLKLARFSRVPVTLLHCPLFSLPNQPMDHEIPLENLLASAGLSDKSKVGLVGWKMFTPAAGNGSAYFDLPWFIVDAVQRTLKKEAELLNSAHLFISGAGGARVTNNANEIAHYEYGANLASNCILNAMDAVEVGVREIDLGALLAAEGQYNTVVSIAATGVRFDHANLYPTYKKLQQGDPLSLTTGFKGGLSSRAAFVIAGPAELPDAQKDWLDRIAKPYFSAQVAWLENIRVGMSGGELYNVIEDVLPKARYGWHLNPGHLVADEEWMSSPVYPNSSELLKSGMLLQIDIIPSVPGYNGVSAEECIALADSSLQAKIAEAYPQLWQRITRRRDYLRDEIGIKLSADVLPLSNAVGYLRPFLLAKHLSLSVKK